MKKLDLNKILNYSLIVLGVLYLTHCQPTKEVAVIPEDYISPREFKYRMDVIDLVQKNQTLEYEIQGIKKAIIKDSVFIHNATNHEIDSLFTGYFNS